MPAGLLLPWMIARLRRPDPVARTLALAIAIGVTVFSFSPSKQTHYLLPVYPLAAVWAGVAMKDAAERADRRRLAFASCAVLVVAAAGWAADAIAAGRAEPSSASIMRDYRGMTAGKPVAMLDRHPVLAYHLDRPDLGFPDTPADAVASIEDTWGFLIVDLERGETLPPALRALHVLNSWPADGHTYVLLTAARSRPVGLESGPGPSPR
jgi:hypothetical protein